MKQSSRLLCAALVVGAGVAAPAEAQRRTRIGTLTCDLSAGIGFVIFQKQEMRCTFHPAKGGPASYYTGQIADYGVALGGVREGYLVWGVIAATKGMAPGALAGTYAGVGAEASAGVGLGANVLVGGTGRAFSLQPLSVQGQVGVNVAAKITSVTLTAVPRAAEGCGEPRLRRRWISRRLFCVPRLLACSNKGGTGPPRRPVPAWHMDRSFDWLRRTQGDFLGAVGFGPTECPYRVVASGAYWRLRDYGGDGGRPLLVVAAPIKHPYLWDLTPAVSAVRDCLAHGLQVSLLEWMAPEDGAPQLGLDHYAHEAIGICAARIARQSNTAKPVLIGHSLGGTFAAIHAAVEPENVGGLVMLGAPLCFASETSRFRDAVVALAPAHWSESTVLPGFVLSEFCAVATPDIFLWSRWADLARGFNDPWAMEMHMRVERWALDELPLSGRLVEEVLQWLYREDRFCRGCLGIGGKRVGPQNILAPTLAVVTTSDDVVPLASVVPFLAEVSNENVKLVEYGGEAGVGLQHLGILAGRRAHATIWPQILNWIDKL